MMNEQMAVEAILQDSSLTDELNDRAANLLIDWGVRVSCIIAKSSSSDAETDILLQKLRSLMRRINSVVARTDLNKESSKIDELLNIIADSWEIPVLIRTEGRFPLDEILIRNSEEILPVLLSWLDPKEGNNV